MKFERYQSYKDSGIEWIESLPIDWKVKRLKEILSEVIYGTSEKTKESGKYEVLGMGDINEGKVSFPKKRFIDDISLELLLKKNDLLFNRTNSIALVGKVGRIEEDLKNITFASYLIRLRVKDNQSSKYFWYFLNSECFLRYSRSNAIQTANQANLSSSKIRQFKIIDIPLNLQKTIANYLDTKTAQIDRKIDLLTQKANLYSNLKQSLINETVTSGLDKSVPMKDSGIEWLGEIPEHWEEKRVKDIATLERGKFTHRPRNDPQMYDGIHPFIQTGDVARAIKYVTTYKQTLSDKGTQVSKWFPKGTLVMAIAANIGDVAIVDFDTYFPDSIIAYKSKSSNKDYLFYLFSATRHELDKVKVTSTQDNLNLERLNSLIRFLPPLPEQKAIADYLDTKTAQIDQIIQTINTQIEKLKEFRKTLINDVVTGKIKV